VPIGDRLLARPRRRQASERHCLGGARHELGTPVPVVAHSRRPLIIVAVSVAALLLVASCGDDDDDRSADDGRDTSTSIPTSTTHPSATGETQEAAFSVIESLVLEMADAVDRLYEDPAAAGDPDNPDVERLREIFLPDSETPDQILAEVNDMADRGDRVQPGPSGTLRTSLVHGFQAVDADTVTFNLCSTLDQDTVDTAGTVVDSLRRLAQAGGEAQRIDGVWRISTSPDVDASRDLTGTVDHTLCGALYPGEGTSP